MNIHELISHTIADTKASLWPAFAPELVLCVTIFVMLLVRLFRWGQRVDSYLLALAGSAIALYLACPWEYLGDPAKLSRYELFTGMLVYDPLSVYFRSFLLLFACLFAVFTRLSGIPDREDGPDFYCLVLGATLGMCLMASANHLLMVFLAVEMASVPSYVLAAAIKGRSKASEAALKYSVYGAGTAGVMLYGISLLAGMLNTAHLPTMAAELAQRLPTLPSEQVMVLVLGGLMVMVGLSFKLSAVPFHFWCPDVFEGATAEVNAFLSVASKAAAMALLIRVALGLGVVPAESSAPPLASADRVVVATAVDGPPSAGQFAVADEPEQGTDTAAARGAVEGLAPVRQFMAMVIALIAVVTCTFGNLAAYGQTNIKRLLAYSTIAHAGYMMMAVPPALAIAGVNRSAAQEAIAALALYVGVYLFMNLGAFSIVAFLRNAINSEQIDDYSGLVHRSPGVVVCLSAIMFSLVGLPPFAGFVGKFAIFAAVMDGYAITGRTYLLVLLIVGGLNTAISLFYYLRVVKVMTIDPQREKTTQGGLPMFSLAGIYTAAVTLPLILLFLSWDALHSWTLAAASHLF